MELSVKDFAQGKEVSKLTVADEVFSVEYNEALIHQVATAFLAGARQGSKAQKNRSDVRGGGAKPWNQKGTGRARAGTKSSPIWRSGGVTFAARPRDFAQKVNRKMYSGALRSILSELVRANRLSVVEQIEIKEVSTKALAATLAQLELKNVLIVSGEVDINLYLSARNLPHVGVIDVSVIDPVSLVSYENVVMTESAIKQLEEKFK